jgi:sialate O-acetylesterase
MRTGLRFFCGLTAVAGMVWVGPAQAAVTMPSIFGDHMVLQQDETVPVWGWAEQGEAVTVTLGKQTAEAVTGEDGTWRVDLRRMKAGGPYELTVAGKDTTRTITDVLVGEVWVGSGQSNMGWPVNRSTNAEAEIAAANFPEIRLFSVELKVATEPQDNCVGSWVVCTPETVPGFSAVLYFFGRELHQQLALPMGLINTSWGGTPAEAWATRESMEADPSLKYLVEMWDQKVADYPVAKEAYDKALAEWQVAADAAKTAGQEAPAKPTEPQGPTSSWLAAGLYNQMIAPITPFAIQGAIWYQGESNAGRAYEYRTLFPTMINSWRGDWEQGDFPFYFVQLANFMERKAEPGDSAWAELREAQTMTLTLPNTGMATIIDIGDAADIHPQNKQDVGKRLALNALAKDYGKGVAYSGPMYASHSVDGNTVKLRFDHTNGGLVAKGDKLVGFSVAGEDKKFVWADAIIKGKSILVSSPDVPNPVAVRYGWADNPDATLYNGAGLPAVPFRTDTWPGITDPKK